MRKMNSSQPGSSGLRNMDSDESDTKSNKRQKIYVMDDSEIKHEGYMNMSYESDSEMKFEDESGEELEEEGLEDDELFDEPGHMLRKSNFKQYLLEGETDFEISPKGSGPHDIFEVLLDDNFFSMIVAESNKYAETKRRGHWKKLTEQEFRKFLGLLLHMGTIKCSRIQNYWSNNRLFNFNCFSQHMSRDRFRDILQSLHFSSNDESNINLDKIQPIIDYFNSKMKAICPSYRESSSTEINSCKGKPAFRQFVTGSKCKYVIKLFVVAENSGIVLNIKAHSGKVDEISEKKLVVNRAEVNSSESDNKNKEALKSHEHDELTSDKDKKAQMLSYYTCSRRNFDWSIKLWINVVEILLLNSFFLYSKRLALTSNKKIHFYDFRINIIDALLFEDSLENVSEGRESTSLPEHTPEILPRGINKIKRKRCRQCFASSIRKDTKYFCGACEGSPGLCLGKCFKEYHRRK